MANYQLVEKHAIEHHNEYFEVRINNNDAHPFSYFFITNEENLEVVAEQLVKEHASNAKDWTVIPHRKDS